MTKATQLYRRTDPITSKQAAFDLVESGRIGKRQQQVLDLVRDFPDRTHGELSILMYRRHPELGFVSCAYSPSKRLTELNDKGLIKVSGVRKCADSNKESRTWRIVEQ